MKIENDGKPSALDKQNGADQPRRRKTLTEQQEAINAAQARLNAKQARLDARAARVDAQLRKKRTHALIIAGTLLEKFLLTGNINLAQCLEFARTHGMNSRDIDVLQEFFGILPIQNQSVDNRESKVSVR